MLLMSEMQIKDNVDEGVTSTNTPVSSNDNVASEKTLTKVDDNGK